MAIPIKRMSGGFVMLPEGDHILKITEVDYKEDFGKLEVKMETQAGLTHVERYSLQTKTGDVNEGALNAFSYMASNAMQKWDMEEIDEQELVGKFIAVDVIHVESKTISDKTGKPFVNVNFKTIKESDGWEEIDVSDDDLDDFLDL